MSQVTPPERIQFLIAGYVHGDLNPDEAQELAYLIAKIPSLSDDIDSLQSISEMVQGITDVAPPPELRARILTSGLQPIIPQAPPAPTPISRKRRSWRSFGSAIAAIFIVALGINNYRLWRSLEAERAMPEQTPPADLLRYSLTSPDTIGLASVSITVDPNTLEAQLTARNLPVLSSQQVYAVWTLPQDHVPATTDAKGAILTGVFQVDARGNGSATLTVPALYRRPTTIAKLAVTMEDATRPQRHEGSVFLISE